MLIVLGAILGALLVGELVAARDGGVDVRGAMKRRLGIKSPSGRMPQIWRDGK